VKPTTAVIALLLLLATSLLACSDDEGDRVNVVLPQPVEVLPRVSCCDFENRSDCRNYPSRKLDKRGFLRAHRVCFEDGACLTGCPE